MDALTGALSRRGCRGWSISIYDPEQDPGGSDTRRIVALVGEIASHLPADASA